MLRTQKALIVVIVGMIMACTSDEPTTSNTGGSWNVTQSGGVTATGAMLATGGILGTGGIGSGGINATGSSLATGAILTTGGTATGGVVGSGGVSGTGGTGGMVETGGSMSTTTPTPSAGCSKAAGRPANGTVTVSNAYYLAFPSSYDGTTPMPALLGFHGCGSGNRGTDLNSTEWMNYTNGTSFENEYVRAVPISTDSGGCWSYGTDISKVKAMYDDLLANYCVDTERVFATGHSSGSQFLVQMLANKSDADHIKLKAVAPVAADPYDVVDPMPVMYIDGIMDNQRSATSASETVKRFRAANMCADTSTTYAPVMSCTSSEGPMVDPGCITYDGCSVPTIWCAHNDPFYGGTQHGIPCFAVTAMYDFFESLP